MIKAILSENNESNLLSQSQTTRTCTCYACGICIGCLLFLPSVGLAISISLGSGLVAERDKS